MNNLNRKFHSGAAAAQACVFRPLPVWKRALDFAVILILLPAVLLISLLVALLIKLGSPGPILFRQTRVGYLGREFTIYKFRTMKPDSEIESHRAYTRQLIRSDAPMTKLDAQRDPRLIPCGSFLRSSGLDELPQLLNVLKGEMSLVGPRPCVKYEYELYDSWEKRRLEAVPGLTGLWQVSGKNNTTFHEMVDLDIRYAETSSLLLDVEIMVRTPLALLRQLRENRAARRENTLISGKTILDSAE